MARHKIGRGTGEEYSGPAALRRFAKTACRRPLNDLLMKWFVVDNGSGHVCGNPAREYAIDLNMVGGPGNGEGFCKLYYAAFTG